MEHTARTDANVRELSREEGRELFDRQARRYLDMTGEEFLKKWDSGEFGDPDDRRKNPPGVMRLAMLLPFVR
ncbi:MAG: hypothetical protein ACRDSJ_12425 [Rubrobacteraceae bacterium]